MLACKVGCRVVFLTSVASADVLRDVLVKDVHVATLPGPHREIFERLEEFAGEQGLGNRSEIRMCL